VKPPYPTALSIWEELLASTVSNLSKCRVFARLPRSWSRVGCPEIFSFPRNGQNDYESAGPRFVRKVEKSPTAIRIAENFGHKKGTTRFPPPGLASIEAVVDEHGPEKKKKLSNRPFGSFWFPRCFWVKLGSVAPLLKNHKVISLNEMRTWVR